MDGEFYSNTRKVMPFASAKAEAAPSVPIDSARGDALDDGSPNNGNRIEIGPTDLAWQEWHAAGLQAPDLQAMRAYRLDRIVKALHERDWGGVLLFDPLNIRYASDSTSMQLWNTHNPFRACLVTADGHLVVWDYKNSPFLCDFNPLVKEVRSGASMFYFANGDRTQQAANGFAQQVVELMGEHAGGNMRLGVDKIMLDGFYALRDAGFDVMRGEEAMEKARSVKSIDEQLAMKCASWSCEQSVFEMQAAVQPGMTEDEIWSVLHAGNIKRGGEWIETRLLASGPRTNPWFQECGPRKLQNNEILAFDTDLVGIYGFCIDISRTWWIGDQAPRADMIEAYKHAVEHMRTNEQLVKPGTTMKELTFGGHQLDPKYVARQYSCRFHGVGLCDEWPCIPYKEEFQEGANDYELEPGMCLCVEALVGEEGGDFCIKLEDQLIVTETGFENITQFPYDARLLGEA